jgi:hypothetical protein
MAAKSELSTILWHQGYSGMEKSCTRYPKDLLEHCYSQQLASASLKDRDTILQQIFDVHDHAGLQADPQKME